MDSTLSGVWKVLKLFAINNSHVCVFISGCEEMTAVKGLNMKLEILTDELGDGSLRSPLQLLQLLCHVTLQIPGIRHLISHDILITA